jgi:ferredoxin-NADP reductase
MELAIQKATGNSPAAFFWRPEKEILDTELQIRVGGRFVYPPPDLSQEESRGIKRIIFVAGGVGINPIMSILEHLHMESLLHQRDGGIPSLRLLYGSRAQTGEAILFHDRIARIMGQYEDQQTGQNMDYDYSAAIYVTGTPDCKLLDLLKTNNMKHVHERIKPSCALDALGPRAGRENTVAYVCGPKLMTDESVETLSGADGMDPKRVLCEKWW